jgi:hypothetical protein
MKLRRLVMNMQNQLLFSLGNIWDTRLLRLQIYLILVNSLLAEVSPVLGNRFLMLHKKRLLKELLFRLEKE